MSLKITYGKSTRVQTMTSCMMTQIYDAIWCHQTTLFNSFPPEQNGRHVADDMFKRIFLNENAWISDKFCNMFLRV